MITRPQVDLLEKLVGKFENLHNELSTLVKKSPNDAVNQFKLKFINIILEESNSLLGNNYKPFSEFDAFDSDNVPSNSDVILIVSQYMSALEKFRSDHIVYKDFKWQYDLSPKDGQIPTNMPSKLRKP